MKEYLAITPNTHFNSNLIFYAKNFKQAKKELKHHIREDTMYQEVSLIELSSMKSKKYFIEKI
jgi:hypothetical protein